MTLRGCVLCLEERMQFKICHLFNFHQREGSRAVKKRKLLLEACCCHGNSDRSSPECFTSHWLLPGNGGHGRGRRGNPTMAAVVPKSKDEHKSGLLGARWFGSLIWLWPIGLLCSLGKKKPIEFDWIRLIWEECTGLSSANDRRLLKEWIIVIGQLRFGVFREGFGMLDWWNTDARLFSDLTQYSLENAWEGLDVQI